MIYKKRRSFVCVGRNGMATAISSQNKMHFAYHFLVVRDTDVWTFVGQEVQRRRSKTDLRDNQSDRSFQYLEAALSNQIVPYGILSVQANQIVPYRLRFVQPNKIVPYGLLSVKANQIVLYGLLSRKANQFVTSKRVYLPQLDHIQISLINQIKQYVISIQPSNCYTAILFISRQFIIV